ncbi:hypothetical protein [Natrinema salaciae]|uniref:Uncharacterized protein n=1 Tax=Natrinema salaciae TaxID=1186196 RepID=A0A1H9P0W3_9EURY|nr:hypothetical protein [Natrinema salaciae]SER41459.1 hypothetical protein SAMN04489841_3808 [Natrinema salaciae]
MSETVEPDDYGMLVYFLFFLGAIFVGPLEAVLGLAAYWLLRGDDEVSVN